MAKYLYIFCYQTPEQQAKAPGEPFRDELCEAVFIEAESTEKALEWGREISEKFVSGLFGGKEVGWLKQGFAHWIETEPEKEYPVDVLRRVQAIPYGVFPRL